MIEEENGFNDFLVIMLSLVLTGLILNLPFSESSPSYVYLSSKFCSRTLVIANNKIITYLIHNRSAIIKYLYSQSLEPKLRDGHEN